MIPFLFLSVSYSQRGDYYYFHTLLPSPLKPCRKSTLYLEAEQKPIAAASAAAASASAASASAASASAASAASAAAAAAAA
jgi:hypothetical protein